MKLKKICIFALVISLMLCVNTFAFAEDSKKVSDIQLAVPSKMILMAGTTYRVQYFVYPTDADVSLIRWESTNTSVATIDSTGFITTIAPGTTEIRAHVKMWYAHFTLTVRGTGAVQPAGTTSAAAEKMSAKTKMASSRVTSLSYFDKSGNELGQFKSKSLFVAGKSSEGFTPVYSRSGIVYVDSADIKTSKYAIASEARLAEAKEQLEMRKSGYEDSKIIAKIPEGTLVAVYGKTATGFYKIFANGKTGFVPLESVG